MVTNRHRRTGTWLVVAAAIAAVVWLMSDVFVGSGTDRPEDEAQDAARTASLLTGDEMPAGGLSVGAPNRSRSEGESVPSGRVRIQVLGKWEAPIPDVEVVITPGGGAANKDNTLRSRTDENGWASFDRVPYDGSHVASAGASAAPISIQELIRFSRNDFTWQDAKEAIYLPADDAIRGPQHTLTLQALPLDVAVHTADDGQEMHGLPLRAKPLIAGQHVRSSDGQKLWVHADSQTGSAVRASVPPTSTPQGYLADDIASASAISPVARELIAVVPLRPEAELYVVPTAVGEWVYAISVDGKPYPKARVDSDGFGRERVYDIAFRPGMQVSVIAHDERTKQRCWGEITFDHDHHAARLLSLRKVEKKDRKALAAQIPIRISAGAYRAEIRFSALALKALDLSFKVQAATKKSHHVEVHVLGSDGRDAIGAHVRLRGKSAVTNSIGRAFFQSVLIGRTHAAIWGAGPSWNAPVEVAALKRQVIRVRVPKSATVDLEVVDSDGREVPYATLAISAGTHYAWCDIVDGVQRIDAFTGVDGRRRLHNVPPQPKTRINVKCGRLSGSSVVALRPGETRTVRVVLAPKAESQPKARVYAIEGLSSIKLDKVSNAALRKSLETAGVKAK